MPPNITVSLLLWAPIVFIGILLGSLWLVATGKRDQRRKIRQVRDARRGGSFATFAADFPPQYAEPAILHAVYDSFQRAAASHHGLEGFVVRADDQLDAVYDAHLVDDYNTLEDLDLRGVVAEAASACGRRLLEREEVRVRVKLKTVREVVEFLERCPRVTEAGDHREAAG